ncbi:MAG: hypothetical protein LC111_09840 [Bacteroidia bacterium]|nr:hypothetical protein [Bacteroidia bacterium]
MLKNIFLFLGCLIYFFPSIGYASTNDSLSSSKKKHFYIAFSALPDICFITVKQRPNDSGKMHNWEKYYPNQLGSPGFRIEQIFGWSNNKHWAFETGISLSNKVMRVDFGNKSDVPINNSKTKKETTIYYKHIYKSINIPARIVFTSGHQKNNFFAFFGISQAYCFEFNQKIETTNPILKEKAEATTIISKHKRILPASDWGAGIKCSISHNSILRFNAAVQRSYASVKSEQKKILFWSSGISVGYEYKW